MFHLLYINLGTNTLHKYRHLTIHSNVFIIAQ